MVAGEPAPSGQSGRQAGGGAHAHSLWGTPRDWLDVSLNFCHESLFLMMCLRLLPEEM